MTMTAARTSRRQEILEALARELESRPGSRITTARLADVVGVSEAALYRHFASKAKMYEALFTFAEESVFSLANRLVQEALTAEVRVERMLQVLLTFAERNPGITRVLLGDALVGEHERLRERGAQFFDRFETQVRQVLREAELADRLPRTASAALMANLLVAAVEGRMAQFTRSGFRRSPTQGWSHQWRLLALAVFPGASPSS
jgi:TetR/AcrR family transcriptional regulator